LAAKRGKGCGIFFWRSVSAFVYRLYKPVFGADSFCFLKGDKAMDKDIKITPEQLAKTMDADYQKLVLSVYEAEEIDCPGECLTSARGLGGAS